MSGPRRAAFVAFVYRFSFIASSFFDVFVFLTFFKQVKNFKKLRGI